MQSNTFQPGAVRENLAAVSRSMEQMSPEEILRWSVETYGSGLTMATAFGAEGCVIMAMLAGLGEPGRAVRVFNLETGYQFAETLAMRDTIERTYGIAVELVRSEESVNAMEARFGGPIYGTQPDLCCRLRKVVPLQKAVAGYTAWISAIRRGQTHARAHAGIVEWDTRFGLVKINPLANWSAQDVWTYIRVNEVPYHPLHDHGYPSIGCQPCTHPVQPGANDRDGRWSNFAKLECGLHTR